jgi:hypothetical protein
MLKINIKVVSRKPVKAADKNNQLPPLHRFASETSNLVSNINLASNHKWKY